MSYMKEHAIRCAEKGICSRCLKGGRELIRGICGNCGDDLRQERDADEADVSVFDDRIYGPGIVVNRGEARDE
jgi:hypothetical protein